MNALAQLRHQEGQGVKLDNRVPETDARRTVIRKGDKVKYGPETVVRNDDGSTVVRATPILNYIPDK